MGYKMKDAKKGWKLGIERTWPFFFAAFMSVVWFKYLPLDERSKIAKELANPVVSVMAISAGFVGVSLSILATATTDAVRLFRKSGIHELFVQYHYTAIYWAGGSCGTCLVVLTNNNLKHPLLPYADVVWLFATVAAGASFLRVIRLFQSLFPDKAGSKDSRRVADPEKDPAPNQGQH